MGCASEFCSDNGFEYVGFTIAGDRCGDFCFGKHGPDGIGFYWNCQVAGFDAVTAIEIEVNGFASFKQKWQATLSQLAVEIVCLEDAEIAHNLVNPFGLLGFARKDVEHDHEEHKRAA